MGLVQRFLSRLQHPTLFKLFAVLFLFDLVTPDLIPFFWMDELLLALATALFASWRRRRAPEPEPAPPMKDITPR
jgi:hypothetical protein